MINIVINRCFGGFSLSKAVYKELGIERNDRGYIDNEKLGIKSDNYHAYRSSPKLIRAIKKVGLEKAAGKYAELEIVSIPDGVIWEIDDYDGQESVHEVHRSW